MFVLIVTACFLTENGVKCMDYTDVGFRSLSECQKMAKPTEILVGEIATDTKTKMTSVQTVCKKTGDA